MIGAEQFLLAGPVLTDLGNQVRDIDKVPVVQVFADTVSRPGATLPGNITQPGLCCVTHGEAGFSGLPLPHRLIHQ